MTLTVGLLVAAGLLFAYPFAIYPLVLTLVVRGRGKDRVLGAAGELPPVAMVICALNEEKIIRQKLENCVALDYPRDRLRIIVVSDGSTDRTAAIAREFADRGVRLIEHAQRRGKVTNLNETVAGLREEFVLFSDANVIYDPQSVRRLMTRFAEPGVGGVSGKVILTGTTDALQKSEQDYYSVDWDLQDKESRLYSMAGVDGAMHAIRRELYRPCPPDTLIEDFVVAIGVVRQGWRVVFEPGAAAWETGPASLREEYRRKVRIAAGAAQCVLRGNGLPVGTPARFWFIYLSHKLLRWISPLVGIAVLALAAAAWPAWPAVAVAAGFALLVASAAFLNAPFYFLFGQVALLAGLWRGVTGRQSVLWAKADR